MQYFEDYRRKYYVILILIFLFIYFNLYSRTDDKKKKQLLSKESIMNHVHDHAAMVASTTPSMLHDHLAGPGLNSSEPGGFGMMMMAMTFHGGYKEAILFSQWNTKTVGAFVGSWFVVFLLAAFYEALKTFRDVLAQRDLCDTCSQTQNRSQALIHFDDQLVERSNDNDLIPSVRTENHQIKRARLLSFSHMIQTLLHIIQMTTSYFLMLIAMTFNTYLFLAVVLGAGFGHFLFGWRRSSVLDHNEHCH